MKNLAILIDSPGYSQKFRYLTREINLLSRDINVVVFTCEPGPKPAKADFPIMELIHGYDFEGVTISTDIYTTLVMNNMLCPTDRYFYNWDLEHLYSPYSIDILQQVFKNKLIARNQCRADLLKSTWHKPEFILEDFNHEQLEKLFQ